MSDTITFKNTISAEEFCRVRESVGFQKLTNEQAKTVLTNTTFLVNAVCDGRTVGVVRVLTDLLTDAYITDVIISPDFQGRGLGKELIGHVLAYLKQNADPGKEPFYEKSGFQKLPNDKYGYGMLLEL